MSRFQNLTTGVIVSVDDKKDHRFTTATGWKPADDDKPKRRRRRTPAESTTAAAETGPSADDGSGDVGTSRSDGAEPPRSGGGSGRDAWAAYAGELGINVADSMTRDDIIAAVDAAGAGD
jgi:hypothetical protein